MYKNAPSSWVGVFTNLANAQDWYVKNDIEGGKINLKTMATGGVADIHIMLNTDPNKVVSDYWSIVGKPVVTP